MAAAASLPEDMANAPIFKAFNIINVNYKEEKNVGIPASVLVPKTLKPGKQPLLVRWHGGCLITGHRMFVEWFPEWILDLALSKEAVVISPDYRLMPEVSGLEILQDVRDFWAWVAKSLPSHLPSGVTVDLDNILVTGESAGGWLSLQSALLPESRSRIAAVVSEYPMIDMRDRYFTEDYEKQIFTPPMPQLDRAFLRDYLSSMEKGKPITSAIFPDRGPIAASALQQGAFGKMFGDDSTLYPMEVLEAATDLPPTWVLHGTEDAVVPVEGTRKFEKAVKAMSPSTPLLVTCRPGDHGLDLRDGVGLQTDWIKEGVEFIGKSWPTKA